MRVCHSCGTEWISEKKQPGVKEFCEKCTAYLHCCLNCRFHDPGKHNQCAIGTTEWVGDKGGANFCDEFEFADASKKVESPGDAARNALDSLFGGADSESKSQPKSLDDLFGP